ncbi:BREX-1 system phosphatase PglZ type A [Pueribacillus theae]|uniref:BREX-1 system phosphatase PglZ type A n=1 Tax=Pueribacillus theae TaxID=2171751 RepID=A0A2U1JYJ5_9BACI|nr:BREX-1 system phosphatase PglZ type A [Pueribacillus theae]PWA10019.1 BREX-1 system phosphatase PglZ type A [Pueribacillus theae]
MKASEIERQLQTMFEKELTNNRRRHIVFWYDEIGEFLHEVDALQLENVRIWKLTDHNIFATKYELETADQDSNFLIYANMPKPSPREDWLFSNLKLGTEFVTDKVTVTMRELGIENDALRPVFQKYAKFFNSKARTEAFQSYPAVYDQAETIDVTVLAALVKSPMNTLDDVVRTLLKEEAIGKNELWANIEKNGDVETFWQLVERFYGFTSEEQSLSALFTFFIFTYLSEQMSTEHWPDTWKKHVSIRPMNAIVFMNQWMNHSSDRDMFNVLSDKFAKEYHVKEYIKEWEIESILSADAFRLFDEKIIRFLLEQLVNDVNQFHTYKEILLQRRRLHWYSEFQFEYEAIEQARWLLQFAHEKEHFIPEQSVFDMMKAYREDYYRADLFYRRFYVAYDKMNQKDSLSALREKVEHVYTNWFMQELSIKWTNRLERAESFRWPIEGMTQQAQFYQTYVIPFVKSGERVFVIISDAMRYDIAKELMDRLNNERRASAQLGAMQGVLPSYTELGMAALLPHRVIQYVGTDVYVNDGRASSTANRTAILQRYVEESFAITYQEIISKNRSDLRTLLAGKKLVYIYHNAIDARGDNASTEIGVFEAADEAMEDIQQLVNQLVNNVSASNIIITADHGFIYERDRLEERDKMPQKDDDALIVKRRFILSEKDPEIGGTLTYPMEGIIDQEKPLYVSVPRGTGRFAIQGAGANYVHGGAMLQEIVIPVITFKNERSKTSKHDVRKVDVKLSSPIRKITSQVMFLEFFQTEKVEEKRLPISLKLYFTDKEGQRISNENIIIADSSSSKPVERTYREKFVFKTMAYDKNENHYLILEEEATATIIEKIPFTIDLSFSR